MTPTTLSEKLREIAGRSCESEDPGNGYYCFNHHSPARDAIACLDAEENGEDLIDAYATALVEAASTEETG